MSGQLRLQLVLQRGIYRPGETVRGTLWIDTQRALEPTEVNLMLAWETWGEGDHDEAIVNTASFPGKQLDPGQHTLTFELKVPNGPLSYFGTNLTVGWTVRAHVDLPWARDAYTRLPIQIDGWQEPATAEAAAAVRAEYVPGIVAKAREPWRVPRLLRDVGRALAGAGALVMSGLALDADFDVGAKVGIVAAFGIAFFWQIPRLLSYLLFGNPTLRVEPNPVRQAQTVYAVIVAKAGAARALEQAAVKVMVEEITTAGSGENATRYHQVMATHLHLGNPTPLEGGRVQMVAGFGLPPLAYPSFSAPKNRLTYSMSVSARYGLLARFEEACVFTVIPSLPP